MRFRKPHAKRGQAWKLHAALAGERADRLKSEEDREAREQIIRESFAWGELEERVQALAEHWEGPIVVDGVEREVDASLLAECFSSDEIDLLYVYFLRSLTAKIPELTRGKSGKRSKLPSTSTGTSTAAPVKIKRVWPGDAALLLDDPKHTQTTPTH